MKNDSKREREKNNIDMEKLCNENYRNCRKKEKEKSSKMMEKKERKKERKREEQF